MILSIIEQAFIALPLVVGAYLTLSLLKVPDFSIESAYLFGAVAAFLAQDLPMPMILCCSIMGGALVGFTVSFLNQVLQLPFLLSAIVVNGFFHGFSQYCLGTSVASVHFSFPFSELTFLLLCALVLLAIFYCLSRSQLGYGFAIYGNNPQFFSNHRISAKYVLFFGVVLGHACAGLGGFLFAQSNGFVDLTMNFGVLLLCLTALMIGKLFHRGSRPIAYLPLIGVVGYFAVQQLILRTGLNLQYFNAFQAVMILAILVIGNRRRALTIDHLGV